LREVGGDERRVGVVFGPQRPLASAPSHPAEPVHRHLVQHREVGSGVGYDGRGERRRGDLGEWAAGNLGGNHDGAADVGVEGFDVYDCCDLDAEVAEPLV
jgi:hypothetical protein